MNIRAQLLFLACLVACSLAVRADAGELTVVAIHPRQVRQEFQGMGCGLIFYEGHATSLAARGKSDEQQRLYDDMFANVRTDFLQLMIRPDHEPRNDHHDPYAPVQADANFACYKSTLRVCEAARKRNPHMQLYATLYTPPAWMKTNNDVSAGGKSRGTLKPGMELELGEFCWAFLAYMHRHGQAISYLSICNEPDWEHTQPGYFLTPDQHAKLLAKVGAYLAEMARRYPSIPKPRLVAPNVLSAVDCAKRYLPATLAAAGEYVDVVGCHDYDRRGHRWADLRRLAGARPIWLTEYCLNGNDPSPGLIRSATEFWLDMTEAFNDGVNVWMAYDWIYPPRQGGEALIHVDWGQRYELTKIYHAYRQWCAPLVPSMRVVATEVAGPYASGIAKPGVKAAAFASADGQQLVIQVVAVQDQPADVLLKVDDGFTDARARCWRTSADEDAKQLPDGLFREGRLTIRLPARGMLTLSVTSK